MSDTEQEKGPREAGHPGGGEMQVGEPAAIEAVSAGELVSTQASLWGDAWRQLRRNPLFLVSALVISVLVVMAFFPQLFTDIDPRAPGACHLRDSLEGRRPGHPFGFDLQGCDYYARVVYGANVSLRVGVIVVAAFTVVGVLLGSLAGYYGGLADSLIARLADVWFGIPTVLGAIVLLNALFQDKGVWEVSLVLVAFGWPTTLRLVRSSVLSVKEMDYVQAARALGASDLRILLRHILPNAIAPVIVYATIAVGTVISAEAALSYLGVGLELPAISWGLMISGAQDIIVEEPRLVIWPGLFLSATVLSFILMGDALRDALDPKLR